MHEHVSKHGKMHRKPMCGANKHGKHNITQSGKRGKVCTKQPASVMHPKWLHPNNASWASNVNTQTQTR